MPSSFSLITDEFIDDLDAIRALVAAFATPSQSGKSRIAAANSATLLVAATFEEYVREMAREFARVVVSKTASFDDLPSNLANTAWKRTMDGLSKVKFKTSSDPGFGNLIGNALSRFTDIHDFCRGDLSKDIYRELIHNENNMRPGEINSLFKVSGLKDVCTKLSDKQSILDVFGETEAGKAHGRFITGMEEFFERRNNIAHALNVGRSSSPQQIANDIDLFESFGRALNETLELIYP